MDDPEVRGTFAVVHKYRPIATCNQQPNSDDPLWWLASRIAAEILPAISSETTQRTLSELIFAGTNRFMSCAHCRARLIASIADRTTI